MHLAQEALRNGTTLAQLSERYHLLVRRGTEFPNLVLLKYHMIDSPMGDPLVQQCRGVILDEEDNWNIVSRPFDKFFNHGEGHAAPIDWTTAQVQEKLDGSLMQLYFYRGEWRVASSGTPDASGTVGQSDMTFKALFWQVWEEKGFELPDEGERDLTFLFELMTPYNRVVVRHNRNDLKLIGIRQNSHGREYSVCVRPEYNPVQSFPLTSIAGCLESFQHIDPLSQEGYVVVDDYFNRVKVKHPGYVALHHMIDGFGPKTVLEVIRCGETSEILAHWPEWTETFNDLQSRYETLVSELQAAYDAIAHIPVQKDFALEACKTRYPAALFSLRSGREGIRQSLSRMQIKHLMTLLKVDE